MVSGGCGDDDRRDQTGDELDIDFANQSEVSYISARRRLLASRRTRLLGRDERASLRFASFARRHRRSHHDALFFCSHVIITSVIYPLLVPSLVSSARSAPRALASRLRLDVVARSSSSIEVVDVPHPSLSLASTCSSIPRSCSCPRATTRRSRRLAASTSAPRIPPSAASRT